MAALTKLSTSSRKLFSSTQWSEATFRTSDEFLTNGSVFLSIVVEWSFKNFATVLCFLIASAVVFNVAAFDALEKIFAAISSHFLLH